MNDVLELKIKQVPILAKALMYTGVLGGDLSQTMSRLDKAILGMTELKKEIDTNEQVADAFSFLCDERLFLRQMLMQILTAIDAPKADPKFHELSIGDEIKDEEGGEA